jgi:hypothetical protein
MKFHSTKQIHLVIPKAALIAVFDECDGFDQDETGGRVIGTYRENEGKLDIHVTGIIEAGPLARRSRVEFFQDGAYQEQIFRKIEDQHREIEHLGNWHTHHVNGLQHLSGGDLETYYRTVNHRSHNTSFFYALLVTAKRRTSDPLGRYSVKHYVFRRGDERIYELHGAQVKIVDAPLVWPAGAVAHPRGRHDNEPKHEVRPNPNRAHDSEIVSEFYRGIRPFSNAKLGMYWRGPLDLLDGSKVEVVLLEDSTAANPTYTVTLREPPPALKSVAEEIATVEFQSARAALITTERNCNRAIYVQHGGAHKVDSSA